MYLYKNKIVNSQFTNERSWNHTYEPISIQMLPLIFPYKYLKLYYNMYTKHMF